MEMITTQNLRKSYKNRPAVKGISLQIQKGEFYGLLGPNGAGKTTTISLLSTILKPDEGEIFFKGKNINRKKEKSKQIIGVVPQEITLYEDLSAYRNLLFWGGMYQVPAKQLRHQIDETLKLFGLFERKNDRIRTYSGGMKRRINIAAALLHRPEILFMDEPTVGIDPQSRNLIFEVVEKLHQQGLTIIYTTHYMEEAERLCDRIGIIDNGKIIAEGTLNQLKQSSGLKEVIAVDFEQLTDADSEKIRQSFKDVRQHNRTLYFNSDQTQSTLSEIISKCHANGLEISNIDIQKTNLETLFLNLTGKQLRD